MALQSSEQLAKLRLITAYRRADKLTSQTLQKNRKTKPTPLGVMMGASSRDSPGHSKFNTLNRQHQHCLQLTTAGLRCCPSCLNHKFKKICPNLPTLNNFFEADGHLIEHESLQHAHTRSRTQQHALDRLNAANALHLRASHVCTHTARC